MDAFEQLGLPLIIAGSGQDEERIRGRLKKHVQCVGWQSDESLRAYYRGCKALIFPGEEDFGIVPLEAQACGKPVIAFAKGGALETVLGVYATHKAGYEHMGKPPETPTGVFFADQTPASLVAAVRFFEQQKNLFNPLLIRKHAERFDRLIFKEKMKQFVEKLLC